MCGRFVTVKTRAEQDHVDAILALDPDFFQRPNWRDFLFFNVAPTQIVQAIRDVGGKRESFDARFGLLPAWAKEASFASRTFNARMETVAEKPSFRNAFKSRRALGPALGYYEWQTVGKVKTPYFVYLPDTMITFACLYEDNSRWGASMTIITAPAPERMQWLHDRIPVIMPPNLRDAWLDPSIDSPDEVAAILQDAVDNQPELSWYEVGKAVGNPRNQGPELMEPVASQGSLL
ncbi:SOS response-associated peptidase [Haematomicrobium sanguinis]|uniref:SOS response-associated peptidase n=1 Tax=Haematomicrobium sanguinis TaxID=479106 RepID=UPI00054E95DF|nr:SOS response-associated peptidase [Haematomicrobium sanguinis]